jgi:maltooligosyltrehalose synthase
LLHHAANASVAIAGDHLPLEIAADRRDNLVAFARSNNEGALIVIALGRSSTRSTTAHPNLRTASDYPVSGSRHDLPTALSECLDGRRFEVQDPIKIDVRDDLPFVALWAE